MDPRNLIVEINSSRYAYNANQTNVIQSVVGSILTLAFNQGSDLLGAKLFKEVQRMIQNFLPLLLTYCKSPAAQLDCLYGLEEHCNNNGDFSPIAKNTLHLLYEKDVVSEEAVMKWYKDEDEKFPEFGPKLRKQVKPFIDWLAESESEEEESD